MRTAWRNFTRNRRATVAAVLAAAALTAFLLIFSHNIRVSEAELDNAYDTIPVSAYVAGSSATQPPRIGEALYADILGCGFVASSRAAAQYGVRAEDILRALDHIDADAPLREYASSIEWLQGYGEDVFTGNEAVCVAPRSAGLALGDTLEAPFRIRRSVAAKLVVAGLYGSELDAGMNGATFYCPLGTLRALFAENGLRVEYCALEMELANTRELNDFKARMKELKLDGGFNRLVVNDALLIGVTTQLQRHIRLLKALLPLLFALVAAIGFGLSFLLLRGRRREAAVMRSLGESRGRVFCVLLMETALQAVFGTALGALAALLVTGTRAVNPATLALVFACYLPGGAAAVFRLTRVNVLGLMTAKE
ncbi:MAG TPA: hypothetical protein PKW41_06725 [Clostridia bacterium]|jgi:predicted lysophospholipase L1 biosynthesis ABC-type transport system permease subunit|nr:hypothetical protein [Clostridia bacterium]